MSDSSAPPFPLPDLPRAPDSDLARMARRVLEHRDYEALTRLPDMLRDMGRDADARAVMLSLVPHSTRARSRSDQLVANWPAPNWADIEQNFADLFWWEIFDWAATLATYGRPTLSSGTRGTVSVAGRVVGSVQSWEIIPPGVITGTEAPTGTYTDALNGIVPLTAAGLHAIENHPGYEYAIHPVNLPPIEPGWEPNPHAQPWVPDTRCWMRRRAT